MNIYLLVDISLGKVTSGLQYSVIKVDTNVGSVSWSINGQLRNDTNKASWSFICSFL